MIDTTIPPNITQPPLTTTSGLANPINLTCSAIGNPAPTYEWYKDGILIPGEHLPFLYIAEVLPNDRGNYSCRAVNINGQRFSEPALLTIPGKQYRTIIMMMIDFHVFALIQECINTQFGCSCLLVWTILMRYIANPFHVYQRAKLHYIQAHRSALCSTYRILITTPITNLPCTPKTWNNVMPIT